MLEITICDEAAIILLEDIKAGKYVGRGGI
jgi:hypothetical protein